MVRQLFLIRDKTVNYILINILYLIIYFQKSKAHNWGANTGNPIWTLNLPISLNKYRFFFFKEEGRVDRGRERSGEGRNALKEGQFIVDFLNKNLVTLILYHFPVAINTEDWTQSRPGLYELILLNLPYKTHFWLWEEIKAPLWVPTWASSKSICLSNTQAT